MNRKLIKFTLLFLFFVCGLLIIHKFLPSFSKIKSQKLSVLLIVIDTLRADHLGVYGYNKPTSPQMDEFARTSLVYDQAITPAPFTLPAMAALFTGYYPDRTGVVNHSKRDILDCPMPTMAEVMKRAGYKTAAVVSNVWLQQAGLKFNRGFDSYLTSKTLGPGNKILNARKVTNHTIQYIEKFEKDAFFIWAHYIDTHMPYRSPIELARLFGNKNGTSTIIKDFVGNRPPQEIYFAKDHPKSEVEATRQLYDAAIRSVDTQIGRLLNTLRKKDLLENMIIIITADHGESLGDHGLYFAHDHTLYKELVRVPLMIHFPGTPPGRKPEIVSLVDILPSLCQWLPLECDPKMDGIPLDLRSNSVNQKRGVFSASAPFRKRYNLSPFLHLKGLEGRWTMIQQGKKKLIKIPHPKAPAYEFYDLSVDSEEIRNLHLTTSYDDFLIKLEDWEKSVKQDRPAYPRQPTMFSQNDLEKLRALGYMN